MYSTSNQFTITYDAAKALLESEDKCVKCRGHLLPVLEKHDVGTYQTGVITSTVGDDGKEQEVLGFREIKMPVGYEMWGPLHPGVVTFTNIGDIRVNVELPGGSDQVVEAGETVTTHYDGATVVIGCPGDGNGKTLYVGSDRYPASHFVDSKGVRGILLAGLEGTPLEGKLLCAESWETMFQALKAAFTGDVEKIAMVRACEKPSQAKKVTRAFKDVPKVWTNTSLGNECAAISVATYLELWALLGAKRRQMCEYFWKFAEDHGYTDVEFFELGDDMTYGTGIRASNIEGLFKCGFDFPGMNVAGKALTQASKIARSMTSEEYEAYFISLPCPVRVEAVDSLVGAEDDASSLGVRTSSQAELPDSGRTLSR